jgi:hypothetical protein
MSEHCDRMRDQRNHACLVRNVFMGSVGACKQI